MKHKNLAATAAIIIGGAIALAGWAAPGVGAPSTAHPHHSSRAAAASRDASAIGKARVAAMFGAMPLTFEANRGQTDSRVKFLARGDGYTLFLTNDGATLALRSSAPADKAPLPDRERSRGAALASL